MAPSSSSSVTLACRPDDPSEDADLSTRIGAHGHEPGGLPAPAATGKRFRSQLLEESGNLLSSSTGNNRPVERNQGRTSSGSVGGRESPAAPSAPDWLDQRRGGRTKRSERGVVVWEGVGRRLVRRSRAFRRVRILRNCPLDDESAAAAGTRHGVDAVTALAAAPAPRSGKRGQVQC